MQYMMVGCLKNPKVSPVPNEELNKTMEPFHMQTGVTGP